jgi:tRNA A37 threonylcarbamoyladenosine dehydratase
METKVSFQRLELLTGNDALERIFSTSVIIFGIGGVGSWCAEALVRSGIEKLTIVDSDRICVTNINRQVQATTQTVGMVKVEVLRDRLLAINPHATVHAVEKIYDRSTAESFDLSKYDYCIDAIDSLSSKVELIVQAHSAGCKVYTALGAACKLDPTRIRIASLWKSQGCHLGRFVRKRLRRRDFSGDVTCVYSDELVENQGSSGGCGTQQCFCPKSDNPENPNHEWCSQKKQINGSAVYITGVFGFYLAGMVVQDVLNQIPFESPIKEPEETLQPDNISL